MAAKRKYKVLTKKQTASVKRYTKQGKTQAQIAKVLGVSKQRVSTAQAKAKVGKRRVSPFWTDVKGYKTAMGVSHKEATRAVKYGPKYRAKYEKRTGKRRKTLEERLDEIRRQLRAEFMKGDELAAQKIYEQEDITPGDTPH